jgi:hypothetical protein
VASSRSETETAVHTIWLAGYAGYAPSLAFSTEVKAREWATAEDGRFYCALGVDEA